MAELEERLAADDTTPIPTMTTTAPEGADIEEVRAGMQVHEGDGPMGYAAEGSLAKELEKEKAGKKGEKEASREESREERILAAAQAGG